MNFDEIQREFWEASCEAQRYGNTAHVLISRPVLGRMYRDVAGWRYVERADDGTPCRFMGVEFSVVLRDSYYLKVLYETPTPRMAWPSPKAGGGDDGSCVPQERTSSESDNLESPGLLQSVLPSVQSRGRGDEGARSVNAATRLHIHVANPPFGFIGTNDYQRMG